MIHEILRRASGRVGQGLRRLTLGADEQDPSTLGSGTVCVKSMI
jgi:hypothetical protein